MLSSLAEDHSLICSSASAQLLGDSCRHAGSGCGQIRRTRKLLDARGGDIWLQVDGGVSAETIERCVEAGADTFVAGSAVFSSDDPDAVVRALKAQAEGVAS